MTQEHPITPPPELVDQWVEQVPNVLRGASCKYWLFTQAARWGADQELKACIDVILAHPGLEHPELLVEILRSTRHPKPPSLKEQALQALEEVDDTFDINEVHHETIRRALEQLDD